MSILLGDNFSYSAAKPLDGRLKYDTLANMKAVADATMYDGCMAYCSGTDKTYQWKSTNSVDETTGRWREFSSGGGGGHTIEDSEGTDLTQRDTLQFGEGFLAEDDDTNEKTVVKPDAFQEGDMDDVVDILPSGGRVVATGFTPIGTIIPVMGVHAPKNFLICDGTVYNIADYPELASYFEREFDESNHFGGDGTTTFAVPDLRGEFIRGAGTNSHTNSILGKAEGSGSDVGVHQQATSHRYYQVEFNNGVFGFTNNAGNAGDYDGQKVSGKMKYSTTFTNQTPDPPTGGNYPCYFTARPTNTSVLFCIATKNIFLDPSLDFSTSEKVVGTWINGKPLYQRTIHFPKTALASGRNQLSHNIANVDIAWLDNTSFFHESTFNETFIVGSENSDTAFQVTWLLVSQTIVDVTISESMYNRLTSSSNDGIFATIQYTKTSD